MSNKMVMSLKMAIWAGVASAAYLNPNIEGGVP